MTPVHRFLPDGLAGRFAMLLSAALVAANLLALGVLAYERDRLDRASVATREVERIVSLVPALEAAAPRARPRIARAASTRISRVSIGPVPLVPGQPEAARSRALARDLADALAPRATRAAISVRAGREGAGRGVIVTASVQLAVDGRGQAQWLNVRSLTLGRPPPGIEDGAFLLILGLSLATVLGVGLIFLRRLTRPLTKLAAAARAAGDGDRTVRVDTQGPREMRQAATAFNDMQTRIAQFDAERLRTLAAVGHDLRTPITSLRIRAEMLADDAADPIIRTLDEMTVMADGLVAYASGTRTDEAVEETDLADVLTRLCADRDVPCEAQGTAIVRGRPVALGRAFGNLIDNAKRYGTSARVTLRRDGGQAQVVIDDDGPGIPEEDLPQLFEPFVRGESSRNAATGGAGLGLAIAREILGSHGGTVTLENRTEGGLRATIGLPLHRSVAGTAPSARDGT